MKKILFLLFLAGLQGCTSSLYYFEIPANEISPVVRQKKALLINISNVSDTLIVTGNNAKKLTVINYRKSLKQLLFTTFSLTFDSIYFKEEKYYPDFRKTVLQEGTTLLVTNISAGWYYNGEVHNYKDRNKQTGCKVGIKGEIFIDGKPKTSFEGEGASTLSAPAKRDFEKVFIDSQKQLSRLIYKYVVNK